MTVSSRTEAKTWIVFDSNDMDSNVRTILLLTQDEQEADNFVAENSTIATKTGPYKMSVGEVAFA